MSQEEATMRTVAAEPEVGLVVETNSVPRTRGVRTTGECLLEAVRNIEPILRRHAQESEQKCRLAEPVVEAICAAQLFDMWVPKSLDGLELDPESSFRVLEEVSRIDSAAGWNLQFATAVEPFGAPEEGAREIYSRGAILGGALFPRAGASRRWRLQGHGADAFRERLQPLRVVHVSG
ncbi:MAG: acyl-CoA dehydrogenase family protein [Candidatus Binatia bacterium]